MEIHNVKWQVSLSNGEIHQEGRGRFTEIAGELSPWQKLLRYMHDGHFVITALSLFTDDGRTFKLPSAGNNPKFKMFEQCGAPLDYNMLRAFGREAGYGDDGQPESTSDLFTVAEAIYPDYKLQIWVNEHDPRSSWSVVISTHCTVPPPGWKCTRAKGHDGPCAAIPQ
jgi:hypothetical protein